MNAPKVNDVLYSLNVGNAARGRPQVLTPVRVTAVGRKYFETSPVASPMLHTTQYHLDSWRERNDCSANSALYVTEQAYRDECEVSLICAELDGAFQCGANKRDLPLARLRALRQLLNEPA